jgi:hypothetical protein
MTKSSLQQKKRGLQRKTKVYATSASCSVAEVGVAEVAPALGGGMDPLVTGVEETGVAEVVEATE